MRCCHLRKQPNRTDRQDGIQMRFNKTLHKDVLAGNESVIGSDWQMITKTKIGSVKCPALKNIEEIRTGSFQSENGEWHGYRKRQTIQTRSQKHRCTMK